MNWRQRRRDDRRTIYGDAGQHACLRRACCRNVPVVNVHLVRGVRVNEWPEFVSVCVHLAWLCFDAEHMCVLGSKCNVHRR